MTSEALKKARQVVLSGNDSTFCFGAVFTGQEWRFCKFDIQAEFRGIVKGEDREEACTAGKRYRVIKGGQEMMMEIDIKELAEFVSMLQKLINF